MAQSNGRKPQFLGLFPLQVQATGPVAPRPKLQKPSAGPHGCLPVLENIAFVQQPMQAVGGQPDSRPAVTVRLIDNQGGVVVPGVTVTIAIGNNPSGGGLIGYHHGAQRCHGKSRRFSNLLIDKPGAGYTLIASATGSWWGHPRIPSTSLSPTCAVFPTGYVTLHNGLFDSERFRGGMRSWVGGQPNGGNSWAGLQTVPFAFCG